MGEFNLKLVFKRNSCRLFLNYLDRRGNLADRLHVHLGWLYGRGWLWKLAAVVAREDEVASRLSLRLWRRTTPDPTVLVETLQLLLCHILRTLMFLHIPQLYSNPPNLFLLHLSLLLDFGMDCLQRSKRGTMLRVLNYRGGVFGILGPVSLHHVDSLLLSRLKDRILFHWQVDWVVLVFCFAFFYLYAFPPLPHLNQLFRMNRVTSLWHALRIPSHLISIWHRLWRHWR